MAESRIKWRKSDEAGKLVSQEQRKALSQVVRNFNRKIERLAKKEPSIASKLPEKASVRSLQQLISTRKDLEREIASLKRFSKKGAEKIVDVPGSRKQLQITAWHLDEMKRRTRIVNLKRKQRMKALEDIEIESRGEKLGYKKGQVSMGTMDRNALLPTKAFTPGMERAELQRKYRALQKESQAGWFTNKLKEMMENYIRAIETNFNPDAVADIVKELAKMDPEKFYQIYNAQAGETFDDMYAYPMNKEDQDNYIEALRSIWMKKDSETKPKKKKRKTTKKKTTKRKAQR